VPWQAEDRLGHRKRARRHKSMNSGNHYPGFMVILRAIIQHRLRSDEESSRREVLVNNGHERPNGALLRQAEGHTIRRTGV
jgi:hypothetical protein